MMPGAPALIAVLLLAGVAAAQEPAARAAADSVDTWEVKRADHDAPKLPTFRFLEDNKDFFRARLDALLLVVDRRALDARDLDPRFLRWREMLAEIRAARDSAAVGKDRIEQHALLESVAGIKDLEWEMDSMEALLAAQHERLSGLEGDFAGRQRTALVVLLSGVPAAGAPSKVTVADADGPTWQVELTEAARSSLVQGGATQVLHELMEPRPHVLSLSMEGEGWAAAAPIEIPLDPERDRLTFLEVDVTGWSAAAAVPPPVKAWTR